MHHDQDFDVVISGAGMVGGTLAVGLSRNGLRVAVVEPTPVCVRLEPDFDGRSLAIAFAAFRQWRALGMSAQLDLQAQPIHQILVTDGARPGPTPSAASSAFLRFDSAEIADRSDGEPLGYMLESRHIRQAVATALAESDVTVFESNQITDVVTSSSRQSLTLADGQLLSARVLVGADGRMSRVRQMAGIGTHGWSYDQAGVVATVQLEHSHGGVAYEHFLPDGPFAILPLTGNRASLVWTEKAARALSLAKVPKALAQDLIRRRFGDFLGDVALDGRVMSFPLVLQVADAICGHRLALVGDAAHAVHPVAGQGLNLGLKDVGALVEVLVCAFRLGEDIGSEAVLERYARWRRLDTAGLALSTDLIIRLFSNDQPLLRLARGLGLRLVQSAGPARRWLMEEAGGATGSLPRLFKGLPV